MPNQKYSSALCVLVNALCFRKIRGTSYDVAQATVNLMRKLVANGKYDTYE